VNTLILGGGLTGIALARLLHESGEKVQVLEAEETTGGLCRSRKEAGFTFDTGGSHIIFSRDLEVLRFMHSVLGENIEKRDRNTKILYKGRLVHYPFENGLYQLPKEDLFFCINEFIKNLIMAEKGELPPPSNFRDWIYHTFGKGIAELYMVPYNEKIWNYPAEKMSLHWVEDRVPRPPVEDVIKSAVGIETEGYVHQAVFSYPLEGGIQALIRALESGLEDLITCGFRVKEIVHQDGIWKVSDGSRVVTADRLISCIPLQELFAALDDVPEHVRSAVASLRYNSIRCVFVGVKGEVPPVSWLYVPDRETGLENRISFPSNYSSRVAPEGYGAILAEITYNEGDAVSKMSDEEIIRHVIGSLGRMGFASPADVVYSGTERHRYAYVVYDLDYLENISTIKEYCSHRQISLVGRFSQFEYLNMDGCIRSVLDFVKGEV
jgi:protoporphyrinogen oxidase